VLTCWQQQNSTDESVGHFHFRKRRCAALHGSSHPCRGWAVPPSSALCQCRRPEPWHLPASQGGALCEPPGAADTPCACCKAGHRSSRILRWKAGGETVEPVHAQQSERRTIKQKRRVSEKSASRRPKAAISGILDALGAEPGQPQEAQHSDPKGEPGPTAPARSAPP
jgi:hypothetical protein